MRQVPKNVVDAIMKDEVINYHIKLTNITLASGETIDDIMTTDIMYEGFAFEDAIGSDDVFDAVGSAVINSITCPIYNVDERYSNYDLEGATCLVYISQAVAYIFIGKFIISSATYSDEIITLTLLDGMSKLDVPYKDYNTTFPKSLYTILNDVYRITGVNFSSSNLTTEEYAFLTTVKVYSSLESDSTTCRDVVGWIAGTLGKFAKMREQTSSHILIFKGFGDSMIDRSLLPGYDFLVVDANNEAHADPKLVVTDSNTQETTNIEGAQTVAEYPVINNCYTQKTAVTDTTITGVKIIVDDLEQSSAQEFLYGSNEYCVTIKGNKIITANTAQAFAYNIGTKLIGLTFRKCEITHVDNMLLQAGDFAYAVDGKGNFHKILITRTVISSASAQLTVCGCEEIEANGKTVSSSSDRLYSDAKEKISGLRTDVDELNNQVDKMQYFWHDESGQHAGSHITQVKRSEFVQDPENAKFNLYLTNTATKFRNGLTELSSFSNKSIDIGKDGNTKLHIDASKQTITAPDNNYVYYLRSSVNSDGTTTIATVYDGHGPYQGTITSSFSSISARAEDGDEIVAITRVCSTDDSINYDFTVDYVNKSVTYTIPDAIDSYKIVHKDLHNDVIVRIGSTPDIVEGQTYSVGAESVTIGGDNSIPINNGIAIGHYLTCSAGYSCVVVGQHNLDVRDYVFYVGNGTPEEKKNAFAVTSGFNDLQIYTNTGDAISNIDGALTNQIDKLNATNYYFANNNMLRVKPILLDLLRNQSNRIIDYRHSSRTGTDYEMYLTLTVYENGKIESSMRVETLGNFSSQLGPFYTANIAGFSYSGLILPGATYEMVEAPIVTVSARSSAQYLLAMTQDTNNPYVYAPLIRLLSPAGGERTVIIDYHIESRWK